MRNQSGDTIVEVLLATVLLSVVLAGAYTLSNRATRINQQAFERTQISNLMQEQAEYIRAARDSFESDPAPWDDIINQRQPSVAPLGTDCDDLSLLGAARNGEFYMEPNPAAPPAPSIRLRNGIETINGLYQVWAEIEAGNSDRDYWNVHIFGCWESAGDNPNNIGSLILRLETPT